MIAADVAKLLEAIALQHLGIETLQTRGRDSLDFHEVGVASVRAALAAAFEAGKASSSR